MIATQELVEIRSSAIHRMGGFAAVDIASGTLVLEYMGQRIDKAESLRRCAEDNRFIFSIDDKWDLDGNVAENAARFLNHSCAPNCEAQEIAGQIWIVATRDIRAGEEITFNYGYDLLDYRDHPCACGSPECVGYIVAHEFFDHVRAQSRLLAARQP